MVVPCAFSPFSAVDVTVDDRGFDCRKILVSGTSTGGNLVTMNDMKTLVDPMRTCRVSRQILNAIVVKVAQIRYRHHRPFFRTQASPQSERCTSTIKDEVAESFFVVACDPNDSSVWG
jgi:hypothetical protein